MLVKSLLYLLIAVLLGTAVGFAQGYVSTSAPHAVIVDGETGKVLLNKNGDTPIPPASMSKLMTAAIVMERLDRGEISLDTPFFVSEKAWRTGGSKMFVLVDTTIRVEDLLKGLLAQSGNDAAVVLAENISGSVDEFVKLMNVRAADWGLDQSQFANPMGNDDPNQRMSAMDVATLSRKIWYDFPQYQYLFSLPSFTWSDIEQPNRNPLLRTFEGADGLKTGYTEDAGWSLAATAQKDGERRFLVAAGFESSTGRSRETTRLMDVAFDQFKRTQFFTAGDTVGVAEVFGGQAPEVSLKIDATVSHVLHRRQRQGAEAVFRYTGPLAAPIREGDQVAVLRLSIPDVGTTEYPLYAAEDVAELGVIEKMKLGVRLLFTPPERPAF